MSNEERLAELLLRWDELTERQPGATPADVCADCPDMTPELERLLKGRKRMRRLLGGKSEKMPVVEMPEQTGQYQARRLLAEGGLGRVFVADDTELRREVALKCLRPAVAHHARLRQLFLRECHITSRLNHPGVAPVYGAGVDAEGEPFYAMRLIRGRTLQEAISSFHGDHKPESAIDWGASLEFRKLLRSLIAACETMAYAHSRGVVHRDIKPANIMLGPFGETLVVDWGLAKEIAVSTGANDSKAGSKTAPMSVEATVPPEIQPDEVAGTKVYVEATQPGRELGSLAYMSPEQAQGDLEMIGPASDIFSLGATLWTMLAGRARYVGEVTPTLKQAARTGKYESPATQRADVPPALAAICAKAMHTDLEQRYQTPKELADDLERWLADEPVTAFTEPWWLGAQRQLARWLPWVTGLAAAAVVAAAALGGIAWMGRVHSGEQAEVLSRLEDTNKDLAEQKKQLGDSNHALNLRLQQAERALNDLAQAAAQLPELNDATSEAVRRDLLEKALRGYDELFATEQLGPQQRHVRALIALRLGAAHRDWGESQRAQQVLEEAFREFEKLHAEEPVNFKHSFGVAVARRELALMNATLSEPTVATSALWRAEGELERLMLDSAQMRRDANWDIAHVYSPELVLAGVVVDLYNVSQRERKIVGGTALPIDRAVATELRAWIRGLRPKMEEGNGRTLNPTADTGGSGARRSLVLLTADTSWRRAFYRLVLARAEGDLNRQLGEAEGEQEAFAAARREAKRLAKDYPTVLPVIVERARTFQLLGEVGYESRRWGQPNGDGGMGDMGGMSRMGESTELMPTSAASNAKEGTIDPRRLNLLSSVEEDFQEARALWDNVLKDDSPRATGVLQAIYLQARFERAQTLLRLTDAAFSARDAKPAVFLLDAEDDLKEVMARMDVVGGGRLSRGRVICACEEMARYFDLILNGETAAKRWRKQAEELRDK